MKSKLLLAGLLGALTLTSCVDTNESDSVAAVRNAKANLLNAQAEAAKIEANANASKASAEAALSQASAEFQQAQAALIKAQAEVAAAEAEYQKIMNELQQKQNDLELQAKAKEAEARMAQAEATKAEAEAAKQKAENDMAEATIEHQRYLLVLQAQLLQAQKDLENLETSLKAEDIAKYKYYANLYYTAVQNVIDLENDIASAKLVLEEYKIESTDADLYANSTSTASAIERYKGLIADNNELIEGNKAALARAEAKVEMLKNCEECTSGDTEALRTKIDAKQHELDHKWDAWTAANGAKTSELQEAVSKATDRSTETNKALIAAVDEAEQAILDDPYYILGQNYTVTLDSKPYKVYDYWGTLQMDRNYEAVNLNSDTLAYKEYTTSDDHKYSICEQVGDIYGAYPWVDYPRYWSASATFAEWESSDRDRIAVDKYQESYAKQIKNNTAMSEILKINAKAYQERAAQLEKAMALDSVKAGKAYCDSITISYARNNTLGIDTISFVKVKPGESCPTYTLAALKGKTTNKNGVVQEFYQNAKNLESRSEEYLESNKEITAESEALTLYVKMCTTDEYKDALAAKYEAYEKAIYALYTPIATALAEQWYYNVTVYYTDAEYAACRDLQDEVNALWDAYYAMENGNDAIESAESNVEFYTNQIKTFEQQNAYYEQCIKNAETEGKVNELDIKQSFENQIANMQANIDLMEKQLATKQTIAAAYKAILDSLVETAE